MKMKNKDQLNIIISGIGGQGVFSITQVVWNLCAKYNFKCQGATFKGGAQKAGSIYSEIRIFTKENSETNHFSNQIRKGTLDLIIGLEPWETLRYYEYFNPQTKAIVNTAKETFFIERLKKEKIGNPLETINGVLSTVRALDYTDMAKKEFNDIRMLNYLMLIEAINLGYLPFELEDAKSEFISIIKPNKVILTKLN